MMLLSWLAVWLLSDTPHVEPWNTWFVAGLTCAVISFIGALVRTGEVDG